MIDKDNWEFVAMKRKRTKIARHLFSIPLSVGNQTRKGAIPLTVKFVRRRIAAVLDFSCEPSAIRYKAESYPLCPHHSPIQARGSPCHYAAKFSVARAAPLKLRKWYARLLLFVSLVFLTSNLLAAAPEQVAVYTYHTHPPFVTGKHEGLTFDLAKYLSEKSGGRFRFRVVLMSRPRLNKAIKDPGAMIVPWVNPAWFKDVEEKRYLWSKNALMEDANGIISRRGRNLNYEGPSSLSGLIFGGIRGHIYTGIDDFIRHSKTTRRVNTDNHLANFQKLSKGRIDVTLTPESAARYLIKEHSLGEELYLSPKPHSRYRRRVMVPNGRADIMAFINEVLAASRHDKAWLQMFARYH